MGREAASSAPRASASFLDQRNVVGLLDAAAHRDDDLRGAQVHRALRFAERSQRARADLIRRRAAVRTPPPWPCLPSPGRRDRRRPAARRNAAHRPRTAHPRSPCPEKAAGPAPAARFRRGARPRRSPLRGRAKWPASAESRAPGKCAGTAPARAATRSMSWPQSQRVTIRRVILQQLVLDRVNFVQLLARPVRPPARRAAGPTRRLRPWCPVRAAICCAAARVSKDMRCHWPARCSRTARTLISRAPRISASPPVARRPLWDCLRIVACAWCARAGRRVREQCVGAAAPRPGRPLTRRTSLVLAFLMPIRVA